MLIDSREKFLALLEGKKIGLLVFNKDTRSLLQFYHENLRIADYHIEYVIDLTLDYRKNIKALAEKVVDGNKIITNPRDLKNILDNKLIDVMVCFDRQPNSFKVVESFEDCHRVLNEDYQDYKKTTQSAEFNFRWRMQVIDYINLYAAEKGINVVSAYWDNLYPYEHPLMLEKGISEKCFVCFSKQAFLKVLSTFEKGFEKANVRFILGTDWGAGKTSFLFNRMKKGESGIAFDFWFSLVGETFLPMLSAQDCFVAKGLIANEVYKAWKKTPAKEIYIKLGGRLEEYVYGIPIDRRFSIDNMHRYFKKAKFFIILKPNQSVEDIQEVLKDFQAYYNITDNLEVYQMNYDGKEKKLQG